MELLSSRSDRRLCLKLKVAKYCLLTGHFSVRKEGAFSLPEVIAAPGYAAVKNFCYETRCRWARKVISNIIDGKIRPISSKSEGWQYVFESGAVRLEYLTPIDFYPKDRKYWAKCAKKEAGGPEKVSTTFLRGCNLRRLSKYFLEVYPGTMPDQSIPGKMKNEAALLKIGKDIMEKLRKPDLECNPDELAVLEKANAGKPLERRFLFDGEGETAKRLFFEKFKIDRNASLGETNRFVKVLARERGVPYTRSFSSQNRMMHFFKTGTRIDFLWCDIAMLEGVPFIVRKPYYLFDRMPASEAVVVGADGRRYLAVKENGRIGIYLDEKVVLDGIYQHPKKWTLAEIGKTGHEKLFPNFGSIFSLAKAVVPSLMEGVLEYEMELTPKHFFRNNLRFDTRRTSKRSRRGFRRWKESLEPGSSMALDSLPDGSRCFLRDRSGECYSAVRIGVDYLVYDERRPKITEAVRNVAVKYGRPISWLDNTHLCESGLVGLVIQMGNLSVLLKVADPLLPASELNPHGIRDERAIMGRIYALYPDWNEWMVWLGSPEGKATFDRIAAVPVPPAASMELGRSRHAPPVEKNTAPLRLRLQHRLLCEGHFMVTSDALQMCGVRSVLPPADLSALMGKGIGNRHIGELGDAVKRKIRLYIRQMAHEGRWPQFVENGAVIPYVPGGYWNDRNLGWLVRGLAAENGSPENGLPEGGFAAVGAASAYGPYMERLGREAQKPKAD